MHVSQTFFKRLFLLGNFGGATKRENTRPLGSQWEEMMKPKYMGGLGL
jgi:hypothetical protein